MLLMYKYQREIAPAQGTDIFLVLKIRIQNLKKNNFSSNTANTVSSVFLILQTITSTSTIKIPSLNVEH